jgi:hypothetical protein
MLRMCVLTVFGETDSSLAISSRDRLVGRNRSTRSSPGLADLPGQDGALPQVAFCVRTGQGPRLEGPQVHQRHRAQVAAERDVLVRLPGYRRVEEVDLLENVGQVPAPPG